MQAFAILLQVGQFYASLMPALLNVVPHKLVLNPGYLLFREFCSVQDWVTMNGKPLPALAADNGFRWTHGRARLAGFPQPSGYAAGFHQRGSLR